MASAVVVTLLVSLASSHATTVCTLSDTFHQAEAAVIVNLLHDLGENVTTIGFDDTGVLPHSEVFAMFFNKTCDILPSVWLPSGHGVYVDPYTIGTDYDIVGTTSEEGTLYWAASKAAVAAGVLSYDDLVSPPPNINTIIHVPDPTTGAAIASQQIAASLNAAGGGANFTVRASFSEEVEFLNSVGDSELYVVATWTPWWGVSVYETSGQLVRLGDGSLGLGAPFGVANRGVTLAQPGALAAPAALRNPSSAAALARVFVGNRALSDMDRAVGYEGSADAFQTARAWANSSASFGGAYWDAALKAADPQLCASVAAQPLSAQ